MVDFKDYSCYLHSPLNFLEDIAHDIVWTCEEKEERTPPYLHQEYVVSLAHHTLRPRFGESLVLFVGFKYFHWFYECDNIQKSIHLHRDSLVHLSDKETIDVFIDAFDNLDEWLDCDITELEALMPHIEGSALCLECDTTWTYSHSILSKDRGLSCPVCEAESIIYSDDNPT